MAAPKPKLHERPGPFMRWLLKGHVREIEGPYEPEKRRHTHPWPRVMCLTGVDYFSSLAYQPGIAFLAVQSLSPLATLVLVGLTLTGALPIYRRVAEESPHGQGSIAMLDGLLSLWKGKFVVLCLLGFVATDFIVTITLSAADATAHLIENPFVTHIFKGHSVAITLMLIALLSGVFLKGFREAIGIAVVLVGLYLAMNAVVIFTCGRYIWAHPQLLAHWNENLFTINPSPIGLAALALLTFPRLALGLSGFETGVAVMPLIRSGTDEHPNQPWGRIRNTKRLLTTAAVIMSLLLLASSFVTTLLIPPAEFDRGGQAYGRALAYLAHSQLGDYFGTAYDISTIAIVWFAGASAMAGLLNIVPRYLPRYGMAPAWTRATRPVVIIFTIIAFAVTIIFDADVTAQGGAYATGVLVMMTSDSAVVMLSSWRKQLRKRAFGFGVVLVVFAYTTIVNVVQRPDGIKIATFFIVLILGTSAISRLRRTTELRVERVELDDPAQSFIKEFGKHRIRIIPSSPDWTHASGYEAELDKKRKYHRLRPDEPVVFLEVEVIDPSNFVDVLRVHGADVAGYRILRTRASSVPNAIAAFLLYIRDTTGRTPHIYFNWGESDPWTYVLAYILSGQGDIGPMTREVLRKAEPDPRRRPAVHMGT